jgi:hypothetical protein
MIATILAAAVALQSEELADATKKSATMESYTFKEETKAGKGKHQPGAAEGRYQKDQAMAFKIGSAEGFKKAGLIIYKDGEEWKKVEKAQKGEKKQTPAAAGISAVKLPHEELEGFEKNFEKVEKSAEKDNNCTLWTGTLTPAAARTLVSTGGKKEAKTTSTYSGTAKVWVNDQGVIVKYEILSHMKGEDKKGPVELDITKTVVITEVGTTKVEVPEEAKKLLDTPS